MVVKEKRGRRRYVIFACEPPYADRDEAVTEINRLFRSHSLKAPHVIDTGEWHLMIRCSPSDRDSVIAVISEGSREARPLRTSGTLRCLRERYKLKKK